MILNHQRRVRVPIRILESFFARVRRRLRLSSDALAIALVSDAQIARWNSSYRGKPRPTDVLSFPTTHPALKPKRGGISEARDSSSSTLYLGDIAIAPAVARRNSRRFGRTFTQEMQILILHGILHLMGYDHETDSGQMERYERRLRREFGLI